MRDIKKTALYFLFLTTSMMMFNCAVCEEVVPEKGPDNAKKIERQKRRAEKKRLALLKPKKPVRPKKTYTVFPTTVQDLVLSHYLYRPQLRRGHKARVDKWREKKEAWKLAMEEWRDMRRNIGKPKSEDVAQEEPTPTRTIPTVN